MKPTTPEEAQHAQVIEDIKRNHRTEKGLNKLTQAHCDRAFLIGLVDSQAQKIQAQEALSEINRNALDTAADLLKSKSAEIDMLWQKITEQAAEIEKLKSNYSAMVQTNRQRV